MTQRRSLHIGLNSVDPSHYDGWSGPLRACEADAESMRHVAMANGLQPQVLLTAEATFENVLRQLSTASNELVAGDYFLLTYSGHGGQVPDIGGDTSPEPDHLDETWCLFDTQLVDDELSAALAAFARGVRVLVMSDSCHSGTVTRELVEMRDKVATSLGDSKRAPLAITEKEFEKERAAYAARLPKVAPADPLADVILISGCQDEQTSMDGASNGAFTEAFLKTWDNGAFVGDHNDLTDAIRKSLPPSQKPGIFPTGPDASVHAFVLSRPLG
jgi:metacaspase-1